MKITNVKAIVAKVMTIGLLAGAFVLAAPAKADAQVVAVGVQFGHPYGFDHFRFEQERRREFLRHEERVRAHEFVRYNHGHGFYGR